MEQKKEAFSAVDDVFNFIFEDEKVEKTSPSLECSDPSGTTTFSLDTHSGSFSEVVEEELEWISNKDAFPEVEFGILAYSPVSVLDNMSSDKFSANGNGSTVTSLCESLKVPTHPVRPRSSKRTRRGSAGFAKLLRQAQFSSYGQVKANKEASLVSPSLPTKKANVAAVGRKCLHCQTDKTPQWRAGPMGPKTLCNACGVQFKSGRLFPEYRPACSPTFSSALHSNSRRKVVEMRRQKQVSAGGGGCGE